MNIKHAASSAILLGILAAIGGCGGSSDDPINNDLDNNDTESSSGGIGEAYYIDAAVAGVDYSCGSQSGKTDKDGKFLFEIGKPCELKLGIIPLRTIAPSGLVDKGAIHELDPNIVTVLQSLDKDGDPSNGIEIDSNIVQKLQEVQLKGIPNSTTEWQLFENTVTSYGGNAVDGEQATNHAIKSLVTGKTFHVVWVRESDEGPQAVHEAGIITASFNDEATSLTFTTPDGKKTTSPITFSPNGSFMIQLPDNRSSTSMNFEGSNGSVAVWHVGGIASSLLGSQYSDRNYFLYFYGNEAQAKEHLAGYNKSVSSSAIGGQASSTAPVRLVLDKTLYRADCPDEGDTPQATLTEFLSSGKLRSFDPNSGDIDEYPFYFNDQAIWFYFGDIGEKLELVNFKDEGNQIRTTAISSFEGVDELLLFKNKEAAQDYANTHASEICGN